MAVCSVHRCARAVEVHISGLCPMHRARQRRHGSVHILNTPPDWTEAEIALLMAAKLTPHDARFAGPDPDESLAAVAKKIGRSVNACRCKRARLELGRGHKVGTQWTVQGLWVPREDRIIRDHLSPDGQPVAPGTWPEVALYLGRTLGAVRTRASKLRAHAREARNHPIR